MSTSGRARSADHLADPVSRRARGDRTCVGCGRAGPKEEMARLVLAEGGEVAVDLAGGAFGRGAHVHPSLRCLGAAPRRLERAFKTKVRTTPEALVSAVSAAASRRASGLLASAVRAKNVHVGGDQAGSAFEAGTASLLVVARDAESAASLGPVMRAVASGGAVAWSSKEELGRLLGRSEVAVLGIASARLASAVRSAVRMANGVALRGGPAHDAPPRGAKATEDG